MAITVNNVGAVDGTALSFLPKGTIRVKSDGAISTPDTVGRPSTTPEGNTHTGSDLSTVKEKPVPEQNSFDAATIKSFEQENKFVRVELNKDQDTGQIIVRMIDRDSGEVIREFPPEELRHAAKILRQLADLKSEKGNKGQLVDKIVT